jgi:hypothetical protein
MRDSQVEVQAIHLAIKSIRSKLDSGKLSGRKEVKYEKRLNVFYLELNKLTGGGMKKRKEKGIKNVVKTVEAQNLVPVEKESNKKRKTKPIVPRTVVIKGQEVAFKF